MILAETGHVLSRGQARDWGTDGHGHTQTDAGNDNTRRPKLASDNNIIMILYMMGTILLVRFLDVSSVFDTINNQIRL